MRPLDSDTARADRQVVPRKTFSLFYVSRETLLIGVTLRIGRHPAA
jgi:hypothetical protein